VAGRRPAEAEDATRRHLSSVISSLLDQQPAQSQKAQSQKAQSQKAQSQKAQSQKEAR
jgi:hypothetical protein